MPTTISADVRGALATALAGVAANVYNHVPEAIIPPAVVLVPDAPYLEFDTIGKTSFHCKVNLTISCIVAYNSNPGSLDNLEQLIISVIQAIPAGWEVDVVERPAVTEIGASTMLVSDIRVSKHYTQS
jgi:hypothetical protein